ncbi:hypothetical protein YWY31_40250 [Paenibacillus illinoisensis]
MGASGQSGCFESSSASVSFIAIDLSLWFRSGIRGFFVYNDKITPFISILLNKIPPVTDINKEVCISDNRKMG